MKEFLDSLLHFEMILQAETLEVGGDIKENEPALPEDIEILGTNEITGQKIKELIEIIRA